MIDIRRAAAVFVLLVIALAAILLLLQVTAGWPLGTTMVIPSDRIQVAEEGIYRTGGNRLTPFLSAPHHRAMILEDGVPLAQRVSSSQRVKESGNGSYSIGAKTLWFRSSDGSDPRTNHRRYEVRFPRVPPPYAMLIFVVLLGCGIDLACRWGATASLPVLIRRYYVPHLRSKDAPGSNRLWSLDVLRALALLLVVGSHLEPCTPGESPVLHSVIKYLRNGGWIGVDIFFVLSGFLVSGLLWNEWQRTNSINIGRFLVRRGFKIYPAFWAMTISTFIGAAAFQPAHPDITLDGVIGEFFFLQTYVGQVWAPTWSLAVEEHFYLLLALLFAGLAYHPPNEVSDMRSRMRVLMRIFFTVAVVCLATRCVRTMFLEDKAWQGNLLKTHTRLDSLMFGVFLRYCQAHWPDIYERIARKGGLGWFIVGVLLFVPAFFFRVDECPWVTAYGLTIHYFAGGCLVLSTVAWQDSQRLRKWLHPLVLLGRESYSIYLWHYVVLTWVAIPLWFALAPTSPHAARWISVITYLAVSLGMGFMMSILIERPLLRLRDQLFPSKSRAVAAGDSGKEASSPA